MPDYENLERADSSQSGHNASIVTILTISMKLPEIATDHVDVVGRLRSVRMTSDPDDVPGTEASVDLLEQTITIVT